MAHWKASSILTLFLTVLIQSVFCISKDEIFKLDWQTVQLGLPKATIFQNDKIITITEANIFALINTESGAALFRYQTELPIDNESSRLVEIWDELIVTSFNFVSVNDLPNQNKIIVWSVDESLGFVEKELEFQNNVVGLFNVNNEYLLIIDRLGSIYKINKQFDVTLLQAGSEQAIYADSTLLQDIEGNSAILYATANGETVYQTIDQNGESLSNIQPFKECPNFNSITVSASSNSLLCDFVKLYQFESKRFQKIKTGSSGLITDSISISDLESNSNSKIIDYRIVDSQYLITFTVDTMSLYDLDSSNKIPIASFDHFIELDDVLSFEINVVNGTDVQLLLVYKDMDLVYIENGDLKWSRDESLSQIIDSVVIDHNELLSITMEDIQLEEESNLLTAYIQRLKHNFKLLFGGNDSDKIDKNLHFGYLKQLIVLTANGKVFALDTMKAANEEQIVWKFNTQGNYVKLYHIEDKLLLLDDKHAIHELIVGKSEESGEFEFSIKSIHLGFFENHFKISVSPEGEQKLIQTNEDEFNVMQLNQDKTTLYGSFISRNEETYTWMHKVLGANEKIINVASRSYHNDLVANNAIVLGSRKVLYKYLIPNLSVVSIYDFDSKTLKIQLLDVITGEVYKTFSKQTSNPDSLNLIFEENFIIFSTNESANDESVITVIDLFESLTPDYKQTHKLESISLYNTSILPEFEMRSFILKQSIIKSMTMTKTRFNISSKWIVLKLTTGEVLSIPRFILNGRRPILDLDKDQKSEFQLMKYQPIIIVNPTLTLSHYRRLMVNSEGTGEDMLLSVPTNLESTSVIISTDLDLFVTLVRPSGSFDSMTTDFNSRILLLTIAVLIVGIYVTFPMVESKKLKDIWQIKY